MKVAELPCTFFYLKHGNRIFGHGMGKTRNKKLKKLVFYFCPPGTGKTLIARAIANETDAFFFLDQWS